MKQTFKNFLAEQKNVIKQWNVKLLSRDDAVEHLFNYSKRSFISALRGGGLLFRGFKDLPGPLDKCVIIDPSVGKRMSKDTNNLYQLMMDESESLVGYPSRSNSLICATRPNPTSMYGDVYAVIPKDDAKICYITSHDFLDTELTDEIWTYYPGSLARSNSSISKMGVLALNKFFSGFKSSGKKFSDAHEMNERMSKFTDDELCAIFLSVNTDLQDYFETTFESHDPELYKEFNKKIVQAYSIKGLGQLGYSLESFNTFAMHNFDYDDVQKYEQLIHDLGEIVARIDNKSARPAVKAFRDLIRGIPRNKRFTSISTMLMTPDSLDLILGKFGDKLQKDSECWTDTECLVIPLNVFSQILNDELRDLEIVGDISDVNKRYHELIDFNLFRNRD